MEGKSREGKSRERLRRVLEGADPPQGTNETIWCPVMDCASGPVQKMGQHLVKVHKMDRATAAQTAKKKTRASPESVKLGLPNPKKRSSGIPLFSTPSTSNTAKPTSKTLVSTSTPSSQAASFHSGGAFLEAFNSHLKTHAGGNRNSSTATQLTRDVGKYLHFLNANEQLLLDTCPVEGCLQSLSASGIGPSGILLSHKAAVNFMRLTVSCPSHHSFLIHTNVLPHRWKMMQM